MTNMAQDVDEEIQALQKEYDWLLKEEVHSVLQELQAILGEACRRFPIQINIEDESVAKPEKFLLASPSGNQIKCVVTLLADHICEADLTLRVHKQQTMIVNTKIYPDMPWRVQQIQDAGNHLLHALHKVEGYDTDYVFSSGQEVIKLLDSITESLHRGCSSLALPKKRTLEELVRNPALKAFKPQLPNDIIVSFYVQAQKLILAVYQLYVNSAQKIDIQNRHQVECSVPWLNDALVLFTLALQQIQQLQDKLSVFSQYAAESKYLETTHLDLSSSPGTTLSSLPRMSNTDLLGADTSNIPLPDTLRQSPSIPPRTHLKEHTLLVNDHVNPCGRQLTTSSQRLHNLPTDDLSSRNSLAPT